MPANGAGKPPGAEFPRLPARPVAENTNDRRAEMNVCVDPFQCRARTAFALLACIACGAALAALPPNLPPISDPASAEHHPGKMIWADLVTPNLAAAEAFYGGL